MAKFRDTTFEAVREEAPRNVTGMGQASIPVHDKAIGSIIAETKNLTADQVEMILAHQRDKGVRFGEAAVALGFASNDDVVFALSQQFHYPYAAEERRNQNPELVALNQPFSVQAEAFRGVRSQLTSRVFGDMEQRRALAVVSADPEDGKTYISANLAVTLAQLGGRTLLVDGDLRGPRQHEVFGVHAAAGLSGILAGRAEQHVIQQVPDVPSLFLLPVGITPPNPLELIERPAFGLLMRELIMKFDHVVVDTPAAAYGSDGMVIANRCGAAIVVARKDKTRARAVSEVVAGISGTATRLAGVIYNEY